MCGITGGLWFDPAKAIDLPQLDRMVDVLTHRGPDDRGTHLEAWEKDVAGPKPGVALGFRRLSII